MAGGSAFITDALWSLWLQCSEFIPGVRLGGVYANKSGYHNTVNGNQFNWPSDYSIRLSYDLKAPYDKARAIDLTMDDTQMRLRTGYLQRSALDPRDNRLRHLREFYGTLNNSTVYGLIKDSPDGPWRSSTSDSTHLWHCHESWLTEFVNNMDAVAANASVLSGQSWEDWSNQPLIPTSEVDMAAIMIQDATTIAILWTGANQLIYQNIISSDMAAHWNKAGVPGPFTVAKVSSYGAAAGTPVTVSGGGGTGGSGPTAQQIADAVADEAASRLKD